MNQLRALRVQRLEDAAMKLKSALARAEEHFEDGADVNRSRLVKGLVRFGENYHSAATFLSHCVKDSPVATSILSCLHVKVIRNLSCVTKKINAFCVRSYKLRVPHLRVEKLRTAMHHVCPDDLVSLEAVPRGSTASMSPLEVLTCTKWLSSNAQLQVLVLSGMHWEKVDPECRYLTGGLMNKNLQILDLSNNDLIDPSVENLGKVLANHKDLQMLTLCNNRVTSKGFNSILNLANHTQANKNKGIGINYWDFRHNCLGDEGCQRIAESCPYVDSYMRAPSKTSNKEVYSDWDLRTNGITEFGCKALASLLGSMVVARLGCNNIGDNGAVHLSARFSKSLVTLDLRQAKIGDDGAIAMADKLINCCCLRELLLSGNDIGYSGVRRLADGWAWITDLRLVELSSNPLGSQGVAGLAEEVQCWQQSPFRLILASVDCDDHGATELKRALLKNPRRGLGWTIDLTCNDVSPGIVTGIRGLLEPLAPSEELREIETWPCLASSMRPY
jgi:Ran GTPase-activating protein (RanGAP) involved in mRNA processing and transport